jgi:hypothetical protein
LILIAAMKNDDMPDTAADTRLQVHYDAMWDRAFGAAIGRIRHLLRHRAPYVPVPGLQ